MWTSLPTQQISNFLGSGHLRNMSGCIHSGLVMALSVLLPPNCNDSDGKGESVPGIHGPSVVSPVVVPSVARSFKYRNWPVYPSAPASFLGRYKTVAALTVQAVLDSKKMICIYQM